MGGLRLVILIIGLLALAGFGIFGAYSFGLSEGEAIGYSNGYADGKQDGLNEGYLVGRQEGYASGREVGYNEGHNVGYDAGATKGYADGLATALEHGYILRDPTYQEAVDFLRKDKTDSNQSIEDTYGVYVCTHFARDVCNNAENVGFRCAFVEIRYKKGGHAIIAFDTIDRGLCYFEPQTDEVVNPVIGKRFYQCVVPPAGYYYKPPPYDDTIMDILVIW